MTTPEGAEYVCKFTNSYYKGKWPNIEIFDKEADRWIPSIGTHEKYLTQLVNKMYAGSAIFIADKTLDSMHLEDAAKELGISTSQYTSNITKYANALLAKRALEIADAINEEEQRTYRSK